MPYKFEYTHQRLPEGKDRRVKLTESQRQEIRDNYGKVSQRKLARAYDVSRRLIQFIGDTDKYKHNLLCRADRGGWSQYYNKEKHKIAIREHRRYKSEVLKNDKI